jgi:hypothetical protein
MADVELSTLGKVIKTVYEAESDTNGFTDGEKTKLGDIENNATANPNALENIAEDVSPQLGGNLDGQGFEISNYKNAYNNQSGTTYTLSSSDKGKILTFTNASPIQINLPYSLAAGWSATIVQLGAGSVSFVVEDDSNGTAILNNRQSHTSLAGQYSAASLIVVSNSDSFSANFVLCGDTV